MRRSTFTGASLFATLGLAFAPTALGAAVVTHDSSHHAVEVEHNFNICGDLGTFTFDVTGHTHTVDNGRTFVFDLHETAKYTLVFDDPSKGVWTAHQAENVHLVANRGGSVFKQNFNAREGSIQIIQHAT